MNYDLKSLAVVNLFIVPKHFFAREIIEERNRWPPQRGAPAGSGPISC
jgi:type II restriction enzyme